MEGALTKEKCRELLPEMGLSAYKITALKASRHIFTHLEWHMKGFFIDASEVQNSSDWVWVTKEEINDQYSIPTAFKEYLKACNQIGK